MSKEVPNCASQAVFEIWLKTGQAVTRREIAEHTGMTLAAIRKQIAYGAPPCCIYDQQVRASYSRNYPGIASGGSHKVDAWLPSREWLRVQLLKSKE